MTAPQHSVTPRSTPRNRAATIARGESKERGHAALVRHPDGSAETRTTPARWARVRGGRCVNQREKRTGPGMGSSAITIRKTLPAGGSRSSRRGFGATAGGEQIDGAVVVGHCWPGRRRIPSGSRAHQRKKDLAVKCALLEWPCCPSPAPEQFFQRTRRVPAACVSDRSDARWAPSFSPCSNRRTFAQRQVSLPRSRHLGRAS